MSNDRMGVDLFDFKNKTNEQILAEVQEVEDEYKLKEMKKNFEQSVAQFEKELYELETQKQLKEKRKKAEHVRIAKAIQRDYHIRYYYGDFYIYNDCGCYKPNKTKIEQEIINNSSNSSIHLRKEVLDYLRIQNTIDTNSLDRDYINFNNCLYNLETKQTCSYTPDIFTTCQLHVRYIPDDELVVDKDIETFLDDITCKDKERKLAILQFLGYSMTFRVNCQKACFLYSTRGGTGKSTLLEIIEKIFGDENSCSISLKQYSEKFTSSNIIGKILNTVHETSKKIITDIETFKAAVCGNKVTLERKYFDAKDYYPFAKNWFAMNRLPQLQEGVADDAYYRRLLIIKFNAFFSQEKKDKFNKENLFKQDSLDYLANIALRAYLKMLDNNTIQFANQKESNELIKLYQNTSDSITMFLGEFSNIHNKDKEIKRYDMYKQYEKWCIDNKMSTEKKSDFYNKVIDSGLYQEKEHQKNKYFKFVGQDTNKPD